VRENTIGQKERASSLVRKGERETEERSEKGAVREDEERERGAPARREERRTEASGRLNNIIGGVLTVPGRPRANSSPLSPYGPSASSYSLLPLSLTASYSPARTLRPRRALVEGPTESSQSHRRDEERLTEQRHARKRTHKGSEVTSRSLTVTMDGFFSSSLRAPLPFLFSDSFLRRGGPRTFFLALARARARASLLLLFHNFDALARIPLSLSLSLSLSLPLSVFHSPSPFSSRLID